MKKTLLILLTLTIFSCGGDRKAVNTEELADKSSFINSDFKTNVPVNQLMGMNGCEFLNKKELIKLYEIEEAQIIKYGNLDGQRKIDIPNCTIKLAVSEDDFQWLGGSFWIELDEEANYAAADSWEEYWAQQKSMYNSAEYLKDLGMASLWVGKDKKLMVKFDGYTAHFIPPFSRINEEETAKNRDYKAAAIGLAKASGLF